MGEEYASLFRPTRWVNAHRKAGPFASGLTAEACAINMLAGRNPG
jgi:hypothetical protein